VVMVMMWLCLGVVWWCSGGVGVGGDCRGLMAVVVVIIII